MCLPWAHTQVRPYRYQRPNLHHPSLGEGGTKVGMSCVGARHAVPLRSSLSQRERVGVRVRLPNPLENNVGAVGSVGPYSGRPVPFF
jgi:hypothetical protein